MLLISNLGELAKALGYF